MTNLDNESVHCSIFQFVSVLNLPEIRNRTIRDWILARLKPKAETQCKTSRNFRRSSNLVVNFRTVFCENIYFEAYIIYINCIFRLGNNTVKEILAVLL